MASVKDELTYLAVQGVRVLKDHNTHPHKTPFQLRRTRDFTQDVRDAYVLRNTA